MTEPREDDKLDLFCLCWGELPENQFVHPSCDVVIRSVEQISNKSVPVPKQFPAVCMCDCLTCKRSWNAQGRPVIREDGVLRRNFDK